MRNLKPAANRLWASLFYFVAILAIHGCGDTNNVSGPTPPAAPGPLTILSGSPLPSGADGVPYDITLARSGGTSPYTWSLVPGSPALPNGLTLNPSTGKISGTPTTTSIRLTEFKLTDSSGQSVQKVLSITVNRAPTPLAILTNSLPPGSINQLYAFALSPTGGTTPYTWDLKAGTSLLPSGLTLSNNGVISGTPTVTSNATHTFTLTDATSTTVEKSLQLSIRAVLLSITTTSLSPGTANQSYSEALVATGGTGAYIWPASGLP
ncbi:MAG: putative Ig domain-containing protein, partial [Nitrospirota bacterium]